MFLRLPVGMLTTRAQTMGGFYEMEVTTNRWGGGDVAHWRLGEPRRWKIASLTLEESLDQGNK